MIVKAKEIATFLESDLYGEDISICGWGQLSAPQSGFMFFVKKECSDVYETLSSNKGILAIVPNSLNGKIQCSYIISNNPRLDFIKVINHFFMPVRSKETIIHPSAIVEDGAIIGDGVRIGANCFISSNVSIGDNTTILPNVVIDNNVKIGNDCVIKSGAVIGQSGYGFERDNDGVPIHFPHSGDVVIGNNVSVGANSTIDRGTIGSTIIDDNVKIDNQVQIAHNCHIERNSFIIGGTMVGGGVKIGANCWVAPNTSIMQKIKIGDNSMVGIGSVIIRDVADGDTVFGVPARTIKK